MFYSGLEAVKIKGFKLDENGDVLVENNEIAMVYGDELVKQTVERIIGTNNGEWFLNTAEGIDFRSLLGKGIDMNIVQDEILQGLKQVDDTFTFDSFEYEINKGTLKVKFIASNETGQTIEGVKVWD